MKITELKYTSLIKNHH